MGMTAQRRAILDIVLSSEEHMTAEDVYRLARGRMPSIAMGTVYRNLNHLCQRNLIRRVGTVNGQERYDGVMEPHSHFI